MMDLDLNTKEKILSAAWEEFVLYGYAGARMQRIAEKSNANKAMIYYYFGGKDELFESIITQSFRRLFERIESVAIDEERSIQDKISMLVEQHIDFMRENPHLPSIFIREINQANPITIRVVKKLFQRSERSGLNPLVKMIETAAGRGEIKPVDPVQLVWNLIAMNIFYFITRPVLKEIWLHEESNEEEILQNRKEAIVDMVLHGVLPIS